MTACSRHDLDCLTAQLQINPLYLLCLAVLLAGTFRRWSHWYTTRSVIVHRACPERIYMHMAHLSSCIKALLGLLHTVT